MGYDIIATIDFFNRCSRGSKSITMLLKQGKKNIVIVFLLSVRMANNNI